MEKTQFENYFKNYYALVFRIAFLELKSHADADDIVQLSLIHISEPTRPY